MAILTDSVVNMFLFAVNRIMTVGMDLGIASLLMALIGLALFYSGNSAQYAFTIFKAAESAFGLSLIVLAVDWVYKVKKR